MKKKLEADLISIAHRILKLKNKSELVQLHQEAQKLYEKLSVLCFVEENFGDVKPTIGLQAMEKKIEEIFDVKDKEEVNVAETEEKIIIEEPKNEVIKELITVKEEVQEEIKEEVSAKITEEDKEEIILDEVFFKPNFEFIAIDEEPESKKQITFEDLMEGVEPFPVFVRAEEAEQTETVTSVTETERITTIEIEKSVTTEITSEKPTAKSVTLNDRLKKGISFGLNDRIAFQKNLFGNSSEDLNRVVSQLNTFDSYDDAKSFIENLVKPDYNNWEGKEEYETRFMELVESKFI